MRAIEPTGFPRRTSKRFVAAGVLFMAVLGIASASASREPQLGALAGLTDEYFMLGAKLRVNGTLGLSREEPSALRPPGYPAFVAAVLWAFVTHPARVEASVFEARAARALHMAQAFVLALSSVALLLWLSGPLRLDAALAAGALVGLNPWSLALVGLHHYDLLHWLTLIAACWATDRALRCRRPRLGLTAAGALWGVSNLVRPTTLLLPAFVLVASWLWQRRSLGSSFTRALCLALGMAVAIAPWVVRNHAVTGRFVAVADNPWGTLWGQTVRPLAPDANHYTWLELYRDDLLPLFARVADASRYDYVLHSRHNAEFEAALREKALRNLRERPLVYADNVLASLWSFATEWSTVFVRVYAHLQRCTRGAEAGAVRQEWFRVGNPQDFHPAGLDRVFAVLCWLVTALGAAGAVVGLRRRDLSVLAPGAALACIAFTQALIFLHMMHYYVKWPLLLALAAYLLDALARRSPRGARLAQSMAAVLVVAGLVLTAWLFWGPVGVDQSAR